MNDRDYGRWVAASRRRRERRIRIAAAIVAVAMLLPVVVFAIDAVTS